MLGLLPSSCAGCAKRGPPRPVWEGLPQGTANQVDDHVYLGGYLAAADEAFLRREGITLVVKMIADDPSIPGGAIRVPGVEYLVLPALDSPDFDIREAAVRGVAALQSAVATNRRVLIHCHAGVSRSATVVLLYLMIARDFPLALAYDFLLMVRPVIRPNEGFMRHLAATDARLSRLRVGDERWPVAPRPITRADAVALGIPTV